MLEEDVRTTNLLASLNQLNLKAFGSASKEALIFQILNDTVHLVPYDRAFLWDLRMQPPHCLGISGQGKVEENLELIARMGSMVKKIPHPEKAQVMKVDKIEKAHNHEVGELQESYKALWLPIFVKEKLTMGLWLERLEGREWNKAEIKILSLLMQGYGLALRGRLPLIFSKIFPNLPKKLTVFLISAFLIGLFFFMPIPLRVVAPCEIVAEDPFLVSAPLDGIIEKMVVVPGQEVVIGELLFQYDQRIPLQEYRIAEKQVEIAQSQLNRTMTGGLNDPKQLDDVGVWQLELEKEKLNFDLANFRKSQLDVKAPVAGTAIFDNPDEWRGKKVMTGEKILVISAPSQTKVRLWVPESDHMTISKEKIIKVVLNIEPLVSYSAKLDYVADYSVMSEKGISSFTAEASWVEKPKNPKLGLKGSAILYGENVSLFYWLFRRPIAKLRTWLEW